jgi:AraC-like DNA-binding protein
MLVSEGTTVSDTAFRVGYESPAQFSREYSRKYGESPLNTKSKITKVSTAV